MADRDWNMVHVKSATSGIGTFEPKERLGISTLKFWFPRSVCLNGYVGHHGAQDLIAA